MYAIVYSVFQRSPPTNHRFIEVKHSTQSLAKLTKLLNTSKTNSFFFEIRQNVINKKSRGKVTTGS